MDYEILEDFEGPEYVAPEWLEHLIAYQEGVL